MTGGGRDLAAYILSALARARSRGRARRAGSPGPVTPSSGGEHTRSVILHRAHNSRARLRSLFLASAGLARFRGAVPKTVYLIRGT
jgi:hypothetical protein